MRTVNLSAAHSYLRNIGACVAGSAWNRGVAMAQAALTLSEQPKVATTIEDPIDRNPARRDMEGDGNATLEAHDAQTREQVVSLHSSMRE
jgi:hypothetical protein